MNETEWDRNMKRALRNLRAAFNDYEEAYRKGLNRDGHGKTLAFAMAEVANLDGLNAHVAKRLAKERASE